MNRMGLPRTAGFLLCAVFLLGASQCQKQDQEQSDQTNGSPIFVTTLSLQDSNGNTQNTFTSGQPVVLKLTVYNRSDAVQTLSSGGQEYNFAVLNEGTGNVIWYWSWDKLFGEMMTKLVFQPHETQSFTVNWNQTDNSGVQLPAGEYEAFGGLTVALLNSDGTISDGTDSMASAFPEPTQMSPTQFRSTLSMFTIE